MRKLIILLVIKMSIPINIFFCNILSYFVMFKESYSTKYIKIKYHSIEIMCKKGDVVLEFVKYINGLASSRSLSKMIISA